jgi:uncharacterized protein YjbI with pentapeptide repeats
VPPRNQTPGSIDHRGAGLIGTDLTGAEMPYVDLRNADLTAADFTRATAYEAKLAGANPGSVQDGREELPCGGENPRCPP